MKPTTGLPPSTAAALVEKKIPRRNQPSCVHSKGETLKILNHTGHAVNLVVDSETDAFVTFPAVGKARVVEMPTGEPVTFNGHSVHPRKFTEVQGLPAACADTVYIVPKIVALMLRDRKDLIVPDAGRNAIRAGAVVKAVRRFLSYGE